MNKLNKFLLLSMVMFATGSYVLAENDSLKLGKAKRADLGNKYDNANLFAQEPDDEGAMS